MRIRALVSAIPLCALVAFPQLIPSGATGTISTYAGVAGQNSFTPVTGSTPLSSFRFGAVGEIVFDSRGDLYVADWGKYQIFRIGQSNGMVTPVAGVGGLTTTPEGYGGPATAARLNSPRSLAIDANDNIFTANRQAVQRFRVGGAIEKVADGPNSISDIGAAYDPATQRLLFAGSALFALSGSSLTRLSGQCFDSNIPDGTALANACLFPNTVAADGLGNLYVAESSRRRVRKIAADGTVTNFAGTGTSGFSGDRGPATAAQLMLPIGLAADKAGNVYIADNLANRIRRVRPDGIIETIAGNGNRGGTGDGGSATAAAIEPSTLAIGPDGNLYAGTTNGSIRRIMLASSAGSGPPAITRSGIVNLVGGAVSQSGLFSIYGTNLAASAQSATAFPLPTTLGGVSVLLNGRALPLTYVSHTQINAQMTNSVSPGSAEITVRNGGGTTQSVEVTILAAAPAILEYGARRAVATSAAAQLNTAETPAAPNEVIIIYLTGIGSVSPAVISGEVAPSNPLARATLPFSATVGGQPADVQFLGLVPGFAGLAQANIVVPSLNPGDHAIEFTVNGIKSNTPLIAVQ